MNIFLKENRQLLLLAIPLIITYFIEGCPNFINNAMIAHLGQSELAAAAIVNTAFTSITVFMYGVLSAASTLIAHHFGAKEKQPIGEVIRDASFIGIICSILLMPLLWYGSNILHLIGQPSNLVLLATPYLHGLFFAVIPDFATMILWQFFIGLGQPKVTLISSILYVPINIFANYILMFGKMGLPALGMLGIGLGTAIAYWILLLGFLLYIFCRPQYRCYFSSKFITFSYCHIKEILRIGLPTGAVWLMGMSFNMFAAFFAGQFGTTLLAAQQIGMQVSGITFMTMSGLSQAISIRIGHSWGSKNYADCKIIVWVGLLMCSLLGLIFSLIFWFKPLWLIGIDFDLSAPENAQVIQYGVEFLTVFGVYQVINSMRYALFGALRALKDTYFSAICSFIGFYVIAIGLGYPLLFYWDGNLIEFWYLTSFGLVVIVMAMYGRLRWIINKD